MELLCLQCREHRAVINYCFNSVAASAAHSLQGWDPAFDPHIAHVGKEQGNPDTCRTCVALEKLEK